MCRALQWLLSRSPGILASYRPQSAELCAGAVWNTLSAPVCRAHAHTTLLVSAQRCLLSEALQDHPPLSGQMARTPPLLLSLPCTVCPPYSSQADAPRPLPCVCSYLLSPLDYKLNKAGLLSYSALCSQHLEQCLWVLSKYLMNVLVFFIYYLIAFFFLSRLPALYGA